MTSFEIGLVAALIVVIGLLLVVLRNRQSVGSADLAELRGQLAQISSQSGALQNLIADQMGQSPEVRHLPGKKEEMSATLASTSKSARELNFIAKYSLEEGLNLMFAT